MSKQIPLTQGYTTTVSDEDYDWLIQWKWQAHINKITGRVSAARRNSLSERLAGTPDKVWLPHEVLSRKEGRPINFRKESLEADHIDNNSLNNCRSNLRLATGTQNKRNRRTFSKSGVKGIARTSDGKWRAIINLGTFETAEAAARAYDNAATILFGDFAKVNYE